MRRVRLFGLDLIDAPELGSLVEALIAAGETEADQDDRLPIVVTPNVDIVVLLNEAESPERKVFERARWVLPDGMPIVAVSRLIGPPLRARLTGSDLFAALWPRLAAQRVPVVAVCANDVIADALSRGEPNARFVVPPMFDPRDDASLASVVDEVEAAVASVDASYVFFGLGHPRDALLAGELCRRRSDQRAPSPICLGVGGALAMYVGLTRRAPALIQRLGAEWLYRFGQEPRRLFHRYFVRDPKFIPIVVAEIHARRRRARRESTDA